MRNDGEQISDNMRRHPKIREVEDAGLYSWWHCYFCWTAQQQPTQNNNKKLTFVEGICVWHDHRPRKDDRVCSRTGKKFAAPGNDWTKQCMQVLYCTSLWSLS